VFSLYLYLDFPLEQEEVNIHPIAAVHGQLVPAPAHLGTAAKGSDVQVGEDPAIERINLQRENQ
jgi:hypothetical protein